ncbi:MAG: hypothetical protein R6V26_16090 [Roseovarius sp.]
MHFPHDDIHRRDNRNRNSHGRHGYDSGAGSASGSIALLIIVAVLGGLIVLGALGSADDEGGDTPAVQDAPESITNGTTEGEAPNAPAE